MHKDNKASNVRSQKHARHTTSTSYNADAHAMLHRHKDMPPNDPLMKRMGPLNGPYGPHWTATNGGANGSPAFKVHWAR